jgi:hypothetical protein
MQICQCFNRCHDCSYLHISKLKTPDYLDINAVTAIFFLTSRCNRPSKSRGIGIEWGDDGRKTFLINVCEKIILCHGD